MKKTAQKNNIVNKNNHTTSSDFVWAAITVISLPVVALSLISLGIHSSIAFLLGACFIFILIVLEALIRGKSWIFSPAFHELFGHHETVFRILIVIGGALLILQTAFVVQLLRNPNMDSMLLNLIIQKQCQENPGPLTDILCPNFQTLTPAHIQKVSLMYSLEQATKSHLIPTAVFGSCAVVPLKDIKTLEDNINLEFFAYCQPWSKGLNRQQEPPVMRVIEANFTQTDNGYYVAQTWQETDSGERYGNLIQNQQLLQKLAKQVAKRYQETQRMYAF